MRFQLLPPWGRVGWPAALVAVAAVAFVLVAAAATCGVRVNGTQSLPRGLYIASAFDPARAHRDDLVAACPDTAAVRRLGRYWTDGECPGGPDRPGGVRPLAKALAGLPGDTVRVTRSGVTVGRIRLGRSAPLAADRLGRPVRPTLGVHVLAPGEYWLHSGRVSTSIDSRYAGPVRDVRAWIRPLWTED